MSSEPAVTETVTNLARCLADDVQDHLGLSQYRANSDRDLDVTVTYNGWVIVETGVGAGRCAVGGYIMSPACVPISA